jgi:hypothetical protein
MQYCTGDGQLFQQRGIKAVALVTSDHLKGSTSKRKMEKIE